MAVVLPDTILEPGLRPVRLSPHCWLVPNVLSDLVSSAMRGEADGLAATRSSFVGRSSGVVPRSALRGSALAAVYDHPEMLRLVERVTGSRNVGPLPEGHELACSLLVYEKAGDRIGWHYDRNYYKGDTFTVLYTIVNRDASRLLPSSNTTCIWREREACMATQPNSVLVMNGSEVLHSAKALGDTERRVVLSMVYTTDPSQTLVQGIRRRVKDWSFGL